MAQIVTPYLGNLAQGAGQADFIVGAERDFKGREALSVGLANGDTVYYEARHSNNPEWEIGLGTWTSATKTLARTTVLRSSAGGTTKTTFSGGIVQIEVTPTPTGSQTWTITTPGASRTFDGGAGTTAAQCAAALSLLINDLKAIGVFK